MQKELLWIRKALRDTFIFLSSDESEKYQAKKDEKKPSLV